MSIMIGFDDESPESEVEFSDDEPKKEVQSMYEKKMSVYIPEKRIAEFLKDFDCVVAHDYGDDYHLTDEERQEKNKYYQVFKEFSHCKHKYRKLDQYVNAMREFLKCLDFIAERNGLYDPEKFKLMYLKDKLEISGLFIPKYVGKDRKYISFDYLTEFILSDEKASEIITSKKKPDDIYTDDEYEDMLDTLFTEDELIELCKPCSEEEELLETLDYDPDDPKQENRNIVLDMGRKDLKKMIKNNPQMVKLFKDTKDQSRSLTAMSKYAYELTASDLDQIERYDRKHNFVSSSDMPEFKGDLMNDDDFNRYMLELEEWESDNVYDTYAGKTKSLDEIRELELKQLLESHGWNIRALYENKEKEKLAKKQIKRDKKREKELKEKLLEIDRRRKRRMGEKLDEPRKNKSKNKEKKRAKAGKKEKKRLKRNMNNFLESSTSVSSSTLDWT